jgi:hypothetical protein
MFKMLSTVTRWCLTKISVGFVICAKKSVSLVSSILTGTANLLTEGWNWMGTTLRKPQPPRLAVCHAGPMKNTGEKSLTIWTSAVAIAKAAAVQRLLAFIGGVVCVWVLPTDITNGDLTWFENMLTSSKNMLRDLAYKAMEKAACCMNGLFSKKAGELT